MADSHLQVNPDASTSMRKTTLWPSTIAGKEDVLRKIFLQPNWQISRLFNVSGAHWKVEVSCQHISYRINLFISSVRDEARQNDEFKMQLGGTYPIEEEPDWITLVLGIYTIAENEEPVDYILSAYSSKNIDFSGNPSVRGTRTNGLQMARILGFYKTDKSFLFRPEFIYYYIQNQSNFEVCKNIVFSDDSNNYPLQQIFYGAPGTGKSHKVKEVTETLPKSDVFRTTFHPDSDYSTFVGCYKPKMVKAPIRDSSGHEITTACEDEKKRIAYEYEPQAFLKAYVRAYETNEPVFLVIEEINRGNCAQIFGDMFQLLDRNENGESDYAIKPETAIQEFLNEKLKDCVIEDETIKSGEEMRLPANLHIWATMNTSDQSLFPIDSAFKRRWEWQYMPIGKGFDENGREIKWAIEGATKKYDWWSFLEKINAQVGEATQSEDKKLGFFFCKATNGTISAEKFVGKVIFYLWNDVFKNNGFEGPIFKDVDGTELSFGKFYKSDAKGKAIVQKDKVELFLTNLGVEEFKDGTPSTVEEDEDEDEDGNPASSTSTGRDYTKFSVNGVGRYAKNNLAAECVKKYIELNPTKTADEVMNDWLSLGNIVPHFVESKEQYDARIDNSKRSHEIPCGGTVIYVAHNGYGSNGKVIVLKDAVNQKNWGITVEEA